MCQGQVRVLTLPLLQLIHQDSGFAGWPFLLLKYQQNTAAVSRSVDNRGATNNARPDGLTFSLKTELKRINADATDSVIGSTGEIKIIVWVNNNNSTKPNRRVAEQVKHVLISLSISPLLHSPANLSHYFCTHQCVHLTTSALTSLFHHLCSHRCVHLTTSALTSLSHHFCTHRPVHLTTFVLTSVSIPPLLHSPACPLTSVSISPPSPARS